MKETQRTEPEKVLLVGIELTGMDSSEVEESLQELARLADTAGAVVADVQVQRRPRPDAATFLGRGKVDELAEICRELDLDIVICDRELSPAQARNLEEALGVRVIDRSQLILDIFARRAKTREGKLQVELAQLQYLLPRLTGQGKALSRLGGGIGTRGPGETKLEMDRRRIRKRIADLKHELGEVRRHRSLLRQGRQEVPLPLVALVGYTNAGKSTLLRALTGADVLVEDKLFATLDPTTRQVVLPDNEKILLTDTVGFIRNLPHHLVAAFRATLEEVVEADLLLHVVDAGHPDMGAQMGAVEKVLQSLGASQKPVLTVYNKIDTVSPGPVAGFPGPGVGISALTGQGLPELLEEIATALTGRRIRVAFSVPYRHSSVLPLIYDNGQVIKEEHGPEGVTIEAELAPVWAGRVESKLRELG